MRAVYSRTARGVRALAPVRRHSARAAKQSAGSGRNDSPVRRAPPAPPGPVDTMTRRCRGSASGPRTRPEDLRSEEHTSELQSLMRNSYAVLFLKKKNQT